MLLNEATIVDQVGVVGGRQPGVSSPPAIRVAARRLRPAAATARRLAHTPSAAPASGGGERAGGEHGAQRAQAWPQLGRRGEPRRTRRRRPRNGTPISEDGPAGDRDRHGRRLRRTGRRRAARRAARLRRRPRPTSTRRPPQCTTARRHRAGGDRPRPSTSPTAAPAVASRLLSTKSASAKACRGSGASRWSSR